MQRRPGRSSTSGMMKKSADLARTYKSSAVIPLRHTDCLLLNTCQSRWSGVRLPGCAFRLKAKTARHCCCSCCFSCRAISETATSPCWICSINSSTCKAFPLYAERSAGRAEGQGEIYPLHFLILKPEEFQGLQRRGLVSTLFVLSFAATILLPGNRDLADKHLLMI